MFFQYVYITTFYFYINIYYEFHDSEEYLDFLNTLPSTSDFPTRCWEKASLSHGWRIDAGHVIHHKTISKYLENQIYVACEIIVYI